MSAQNYFCDLENRPSKAIAPGVSMRTYWQTEMLLQVLDFAPNAGVEMHQHPHEQAGTVIVGEIILTIAGETRHLHAGDCCIIPGGIPHQAMGGPAGGQIINVFAPIREKYQY